jgi:integrase/recombinase XerD
MDADKLTLVDDFRSDCQLRGHKYSGTSVSYIQEFLTGLQKAPEEATRSDLKAYLMALHGRDLKQSTIDKAFSHLSNFYEYLAEEGLVSSNPVPPFRRRYVHQYKEQLAQDVRQLISVEDAGRLVNLILDSRAKAMLMLLFKTGMRANEMLALDVGDVNLLKREIRLKPTSKRSNRLLFFDAETEEVLAAWFLARKNRSTHGGLALFPSKNSSRLSLRGLEAAVEKHAIRASLHDPGSKLLEHRFTPHCCRHAFTTWLYRAGMEERYIAWLRGDAPRGSMGPYVHISPEDVRKSYLAHIPQLGI